MSIHFAKEFDCSIVDLDRACSKFLASYPLFVKVKESEQVILLRINVYF
jgi:hypothetical protein